MKTVFSTDALHQRDSFDSWHATLKSSIVAHDSRPTLTGRFDGALTTGELDDVKLFGLRCSAMRVAREQRHIAAAGMDDLFLCQQLSGRLGIEQNDQRTVLEPGEIALLDPNLPYLGHYSEGSHLLLLSIPRAALTAPLGEVTHRLAHKLPRSRLAGGFLPRLLAMLPEHVDGFDETAAATVRNQVLELIVQGLAGVGDGRGRPSTTRALALLRIRAAVQSGLANPRLDSAAVASAAGLSVRYANALLQPEGASIARLIRGARLARCREALADRAQDHRAIGEIAFGWGFSDLAHFGKAFHAEYGLSPRDFRKSLRAAEPLVPAD